MSRSLIDIAEEREDVYRKLKDSLNFFALIMADKEETIVKIIRAGRVISEIAKTLRLYLNDAEKISELEKRITKLEKRLT